MGPYEVVRKTKGGSYVLKDINGVVYRRGVSSTRLIPYISRNTENFEELLDDLAEEDTGEVSDWEESD